MSEYINIHTHKPTGIDVELINTPLVGDWPQGSLFSFGLHPWEIGKVNESKALKNLELICEKKRIIAVGEIGLDRAINTPLDLQTIFFRQQLEIAEKYNLPVIIHNVRATSDFLQLKKVNINSIPWIFHGFKGSLHEAEQLIDRQCFLSFGAAVLNHSKTQEVLRKVPLEHVFFETDDSDENISTIFKKAAEILDICTAELKEKIYLNFVKIFGEKCKKVG
jgi:TatD DNase family protein